MFKLSSIYRYLLSEIDEELLNSILFQENPLIKNVEIIDNPFYGDIIEIKIVDFIPKNYSNNN